jgi:signal transduction histidine kinase
MALLTQIRLVRKLHRRMDVAELEDELGRAEAVAATGLADARAAIGQMRDNGVRDTGLTPAVHDLARRFRQRSGVDLRLTTEGPAQDWADERAETAFRIVEEALRNVERHAQAQVVAVALRWSALAVAQAAGDGTTQLCIEVVDDGTGFDPGVPQTGHYGLRGMHEQAALIDARLEVTSQPGQGTRVSLACQF